MTRLLTALLFTVACASCVHATQRSGAARVLGDAAPANACERSAWIQLAPAKSKSREMELIDWVGRPREAEGVALFNRDDHALDLRKVVPEMGEPSLLAPLRERVEPVDARLREATYWPLGGIAAMAAGIGYGATGGDHPDAGQIAAMSAGLALGLAAAIIGWVRMPSKSDRMEADLRRTMFVDNEYDPQAVTRGALRLRERVRRSCEANEDRR